MPKKAHTKEQIVAVLRQGEADANATASFGDAPVRLFPRRWFPAPE
jgi:hypothetical protein